LKTRCIELKARNGADDIYKDRVAQLFQAKGRYRDNEVKGDKYERLEIRQQINVRMPANVISDIVVKIVKS